MPTPITDDAQGPQTFEWSETLHAFLFRARIYLRRYWWIFLLTVSGGIGLQAYRQYNSPIVYESHAYMGLSQRVFTPIQASGGVAEDYVNFYPTQMFIMKSDEIRNKAADDLLRQDPNLAARHAWASPDVSQVTGTSVLLLTASGNDKDYTTAYLDAWMNAFIQYKKDQKQRTLEEAKNRNMATVYEYDKKIEDLHAEQEKFLADHNMINIDTENKAAGNQMTQIYTELSTRKSEMNQLQSINLQDYLSGGNIEIVDHGVLLNPDLISVSPDYWRYKQQLQEFKADLAELSLYLGDLHPKIRNDKEQINVLNNKLSILRGVIANSLADRKNWLENEIKNLQIDYDNCEVEAKKYSDLQGTYDRITQQLNTDMTTRQSLNTSIDAMDAIQGTENDDFNIFQKASVATPNSPNAVNAIGAGAFVGIFAGSVLIFLLGALDGRVMAVEDITQRFDEAILGVIPMQKRSSTGQVELLKNNDQRQMFAESCRNIRSSLLYMDKQGQRPRTIVMTSSIPAEGKSTLSANLAITLGFAASRTLLVDADLRRGQLHKQFGMSNDIGLAEHIQDNVPLEKVILPTGFENLDFIPCGKYPAQPGELLMSERFRETIEILKQRYDFVIFDSPPILATDDASSFATRTDAVIFVIRAGYTRLRQIRTSLDNLHRRNANIYGLVVNFIDHREPGYYSYKYYDYYSYRPGASERPERTL